MTTTTAATPRDGAPGEHGAPIIETVGLTKTYQGTDFRAVDQLSLRVGAGEVFGLLGPNGAGKTTTVGVLTTRVIPTEGQAFVGGIDVMEHPTLVKQLIGVVSQQNTLDRQLTPWENLYFHGRLFGMGPKECRLTADELLERFQLSRFAKASVYALSGGMAQRLMVARAIFHRPAVLFLDEPTAGLDPQGRLALWELLGGLNAEGQTILLTTHYMEEAEHLCDRLAIMDHGSILEMGTVEELVSRRFHERAVRFDSLPGVDEVRLRALPAVDSIKHDDGTTFLYTTDVAATIGALLALTEELGVEAGNLGIRRATLEDVFLDLTGRALRD